MAELKLFEGAATQHHRRRCRKRCHKKKKKMEGIRLRSDSTGSTKNAFYQGTIVSDSRHSTDIDRDHRLPRSDDGGDFSRRKRREKHGSDSRRHPPLPRRHAKNSSSERDNDPYRLQSPENSTSNGEDDVIFEFSAGNHQRMDSLRYSTTSMYSSVQLLGANLFTESSRGSLGGSFPELNTENLRLTHANSDNPGEVEVTLSEGKAERRRSSVTSINSGVYFRQNAPPGPLTPGAMMEGNRQSNFFSFRSTMSNNGVSDYYPTQQAIPDKDSHGYGSFDVLPSPRSVSPPVPVPPTIDEDDETSIESQSDIFFSHRIPERIDIAGWLSKDVVYDYDGVPFFESTSHWTIAGIIRWLLYNPLYPEFTSLQQFCWAVLLGVFMGIFTAGWKLLIDTCVEFTWKTIPEKLLEWGFFTDLNGAFPLYHYMWMTPGLLSGILAYISNSLPTPIPTQDDWIHTLHSNGIQESDTFIQTFVISTIGMTSGLSLGPELPLILTAGMIGSGLGRTCRQSLLQARVMNLTAASAAIGGMFGFPLAGGIFVMELPHRMGLQYFEALSPATIASIVAVLINRIVINDDVTGMFQYPFLSESLPSYIFKDAIVYGIFGGALGIFYTYNVKKIKKITRHLLDFCGRPSIVGYVDRGNNTKDSGESIPSVKKFIIPEKKASKKNRASTSPFSGMIPHAPTRAALTSSLAGIAVGITGIFLPHIMFWGEAQLQTMIDKRKTPLPIFGQGDDPTADLVALGQCMMDQSQESGLSMRCSIAIVLAKIFVTGLSLGTGIVGGHFWAPLFVGAAASQFFTDFIGMSSKWLGLSTTLNEYPCVALLCIMGATHVVTFRAHMAIILILTLTIDAFVPEDYALRNIRVAGDYSAVFPLLTVAVFVALQISRQTTFYEKQRCRGDIQALPEALCEPGKEGKPLVMDYDGKLHALDESDYEYESDYYSDDDYSASRNTDDIHTSVSKEDIEANFQEVKKGTSTSVRPSNLKPLVIEKPKEVAQQAKLPAEPLSSDSTSVASLEASPKITKRKSHNSSKRWKRLQALDSLLNGPIQPTGKRDASSSTSEKKKRTHRRTKSEPLLLENIHNRVDSMFNSSSSLKKPVLKRVDSYGEIDQEQPSLMDQARRRAASFAKADNVAKKGY